MDICRAPGMSGRFDIHRDICNAKAAVDQYRREQKDGAEPGEVIYPVPVIPETVPTP